MITARHEIRNATIDDMAYIAEHLRAADREECAMMGHEGPRSILFAMRQACEARVGCADGVPVCVFGVGYSVAFGSTAHPWLLATDEIARNRIVFLKESRAIVAGWRERFTHLFNYVADSNDLSIAWLKWLGFTIHAPAPHGPKGLPFRLFEMRS